MDSYLERLRKELENAITGGSVDGLTQAPAGKWNAGQILEHLYLTYKLSNRGMEKVLAKDAPLATRATLKQRIAVLWVLNLENIPGRRDAPERLMPQGMPPEAARQAMGTELQKMVSVLDECERRFGAGTKILDHLFLGPLTVDQWRKFHWIHGRHHARQIRERMGKS
jgi:hypothetical protein